MARKKDNSDLHSIKLETGTVYQTEKGGTYYFRYQVNKERKCVSLRTRNQEDALKKAKELLPVIKSDNLEVISTHVKVAKNLAQKQRSLPVGASNKMASSDDSDDFLRTIWDIYAEMINFISANNMYNVLVDSTDEIKIQIFSDNIVLAKEYQKDTCVADCRDIFYTCSLFQICALIHQTPLRGAVTCGDFCKNKLFVYGEALTKAYAMESNMAVYPRIIVDKEIVATSKSIPQLCACEWDKETRLLKQDFDGEWFVRYSYCSPPSGKQSFSWETLVKMRYGIIKAFESSPRNPSVRQKYCWLAKNFNEFCKEYECNDLAIALNANGEPLVSKNYEVLNG